MIKQHVEGFVAFMAAKGYRARFQVCENEFSVRKGGFGYLFNCLEGQIAIMLGKQANDHQFFLSTDLYSANIKESIECRFRIKYNESQGFSILELRIRPETHPERKLLRLNNNNELPGYQAIDGMYARRTIWDEHIRGKIPRRF